MRILPVLSTFLLVLLTFTPCIAQPQPISATSRITSVTVFPDRAQVTRTAKVALKPGSNLVRLEGLPQFLAEDSLRAEGQGSAPARISGVTVRTVFLERLQEKKIHDLEDQLQALNRQLEGLEAKRRGLAAQKAFLESIRLGWGERISRELTLGKPSTAELGEAAKFVGEGVGRVEEQLADLEAARKPLQAKIAALVKELEQSRGERRKEARAVEVAVEAERAMEFTLSLSYLVSQAHWEPGYDVRLAADGAGAQLTYRAQVWQKSGEEWPGVKLTLSTASPSVGGAPPELKPWPIAFYEPPRPMARYAAPKAAMMMEMAPMAAPAPAPADESLDQEATQATAGIEEGQTSVLFSIAQPAEVPADGTRVATTIAVEKVPVAAQYVTIPKLSPRVYLKSEVTNNTPYPLLPGSANVFNDNVFTGKSYLKQVAAGEKFDLFFGADEQIKVKREQTRVRKQGGILAGNRIDYRITVELDNFKRQPVTVALMDQLPVAGNAEIKVNLEDADPKPDEIKADGSVTWKLVLAPGVKKTVSYDIAIEYPKNKELVGVE